MRLFNSVKYLYLSGYIIPFKVYSKANIVCKPTSNIQFGGRITIGTPNKELPVVSRLSTNIFFQKKSTIKIGSAVSIGPGVNLIVKENAFLSIGNNTYFTSDSHIEVVNNISIGSNCAISWGVTIIDDDHHQIIYKENNEIPSKGIVAIGSHVWIGCNVTILKNTKIGSNCIIAANSLVKGDFPDNCLIGGNPARVLRNDVNWK